MLTAAVKGSLTYSPLAYLAKILPLCGKENWIEYGGDICCISVTINMIDQCQVCQLLGEALQLHPIRPTHPAYIKSTTVSKDQSAKCE